MTTTRGVYNGVGLRVISSGVDISVRRLSSGAVGCVDNVLHPSAVKGAFQDSVIVFQLLSSRLTFRGSGGAVM